MTYFGIGQQADPEVMHVMNNFATDVRPVLFSDYAALHDNTYLDRHLWKWLYQFPSTALLLGIGFLDGEGNDVTQNVADGDYDANMGVIARRISQTAAPVFIRPGFEFDGWWNGYDDPAAYAAAFRRMVTVFRDEGADNVAWVWNASCEYQDADSSYYPGDAYVDWCGINLWRPSHFSSQNFTGFKSFCDSNQKPMFIPESSNQIGTGTRSDSDWSGYFEPLFSFIAANNVKAFVHINWDWPHTGWGSSFADDNRLQCNDSIWQQFQQKMRDPRYITLDEGIYTDDANRTPRAVVAVADHTEPSVPASVQWLGTDSFDPDQDTVSCSWDFGDDHTGTGCVADHTYADAGTYYATLTVADGRGGSRSALSFVAIGTPPNADVRILATTSKTDPRPDLQVTVDGVASVAPTVNVPVGSLLSLDAPSPQPASTPYNQFRGWAGGGSKAKQIIVAPLDLRHPRGHTAHFLYVP